MLQRWRILRACIFIFSYIKQQFGFLQLSLSYVLYVNHFEERNGYKWEGSYTSVADTRAWICKHFKQPRNRFPTWRAGTTGYIGWRNQFLGFVCSLNVYKFGLCNDWSLELSIFCCKWRIIQTTIVCYNATNSYRYCGKVWMTQSQIKNLRKLGKTFCKSSMYFYSNINQHHCL